MPCGGERPPEAKSSLQLELERAEALARRGDVVEAARARERAADLALLAADAGAGGADPIEAATAVLYHAHCLLESGGWLPGPPGAAGGPALQDRIRQALGLARTARRRNRGLEGQLLHAWSKAVFACPGGPRSDEELEEAIQARHEAAELLADGEVSELPWGPSQLRAAAEAAAAGGLQQALPVDELIMEVVERLGDVKGKRTSVSAILGTLRFLFDAWSEPDGETLPDGGVCTRISVREFLQKAACGAERLEQEDGKAAAAEACRAPCDGGVEGLSRSEQALLALVAEEGLGAWGQKLVRLKRSGDAEAGATAASLKADWLRIAPRIKKATDADEQMSCGHSCSTCPSRESCQVHAALRDIEDF